MRSEFRTTVAIAVAVAGLSVAGCGGSKQQSSANGDVGTPSSAAVPAPNTSARAEDTTTTQPHHSKLAGAAVGAVVGHELGHHALAGAAAGALIQHHRNRKQ